MKCLDRYIMRAVIYATILIAFAMMAIQSFVAIVTTISTTQTIKPIWIHLPADLYQLFPVVSFLGCLIGLGRLAASHQLTAMCAAGISEKRIIQTILKAAILMTIFMTIIGEYVAPKIENLAASTSVQDLKNIWIKENSAFIHIGAVISKQEIRDITRFEMNSASQLRAIFYAPRGILVNKKWILSDVVVSEFVNDRIKTASIPEWPLSLLTDPYHWQEDRKSAYRQSLWELYHNAQHPNQILIFWQRLLQPLITMIMFYLAAPLIFGSLREISLGVRVVQGMMLGFLFYMLNQFFGPLALLYDMPAMYAALAPPVLFALICAILSHVRVTARN